MAQCPAHEDAKASLSIRVGADGKALLYCHTGCTLEAVTAAMGLVATDLFPAKTNGHAQTKTIKYEIRDAAGVLIAIHERTDPIKKFTWHRPDGTMGLGGIKTADLPLYGVERLKDHPMETEVVITEGEKDADALTSNAIFALATITGAASTPSLSALEPLRGRDVVLWADADQPGMQHMQRVARALKGIAGMVRFVEWEEAPAKGGAADCVGLYSVDEAKRLIAAASGSASGSGERSFATDLEIHTALFPLYNVKVEFDLVRTDSRGETFSEITVFFNNAPDPLHKSHLNLLSTQSKTTLGNALAKRSAPADVPWDEIIEWSALQTLNTYRKGDQPIRLSDAPEPPVAVDLLGPLISPSGVTIFFGDGGSGKSQMLQAMSLSVQTGYDILGYLPTEHLNVLYLDWEEEDWVHRDRMKRLLGEETEMLYLRMRRSLTQSIDQLRAIVRDRNVGLVAVDSLAPATGGDANEQVTADSFFSAARRLAVPLICTAHNTKAQDDQKPFGSTFFHNLARRTWFVKNTQEPGAAEMAVGLFNRKNNLGPKFHDMAYKVEFSDDRIAISKTDMASHPALNVRMSIRARIRDLLSEGAMSVYEIAADLGYEDRGGVEAVRNALKSGEGKEFTKFPSIGDGPKQFRWGLRTRSTN